MTIPPATWHYDNAAIKDSEGKRIAVFDDILRRAAAYPKLVAHLQALEAHLKGGAQPAEGKALREQQQALLRELGEES